MSTTSPNATRIAGVQMEPKFGENAANLASILTWAEKAADLGAKLIVFPECALTGYGFKDLAEAMPHAETIPGASTTAITEFCKKRDVHVVYGLLERDGENLFNACVLVGPEGLIGSYRKIHLPYLGVDMFATPGDRPFAVHQAGDLKIGMHICYDAGFPESCRVLALHGADLLVLPTNWPAHAECAAEHMMATRAMENVVFSLAVNRVGEERGFTFIGRSSIMSPGGARLAFAAPAGEEIIIADIDPTQARQKRQVRVAGRHEINRIADRRPEFYGPIVAPNR